MFYFHVMQSRETQSKPKPGSTFVAVRDARNRKVRGLWRRGQKFYLQTRHSGERSARRIPLAATTLEGAKEEMARILIRKKDEGLPSTGLRPRFADYVDSYVEFHQKATTGGKRQSTVAREKTSLEQWKTAIRDTRLDKITKAMIVTFIDHRLMQGVKARSINLDVIALRNVLKKAQDAGLIGALPTVGIKPLKYDTPKRSLLTSAEIEILCEKAKGCSKNGQETADYIRFLAYTGARCSEALRVSWEDTDFEQKQVCVGADGFVKGRTARHVDFNPKLEALLLEMRGRRAPDSRWLFPSPQRGNKDFPAKTLRDSFNAARKEARLGRIGFHDLRHYFCSMAIMAGVDVKTVAEWLGHKDGGVLIGKVYSHLLNEHRRRMAQRVIFDLRAVPSTATGTEG